VTKNEPLAVNLEMLKGAGKTVKYEVIGTDLKGYMTPSETDNNGFEAQVDFSNLSPGPYKIRAQIADEKNQVQYSQNAGFMFQTRFM